MYLFGIINDNYPMRIKDRMAPFPDGVIMVS